MHLIYRPDGEKLTPIKYWVLQSMYMEYLPIFKLTNCGVILYNKLHPFEVYNLLNLMYVPVESPLQSRCIKFLSPSKNPQHPFVVHSCLCSQPQAITDLFLSLEISVHLPQF